MIGEKPILFSTEMVKAILDGRKAMTRRAISERLLEKYYDYDDYCNAVMPRDIPCTRDYEKTYFMKMARWQVGDILWVRETWAYKEFNHNKIYYKADSELGDVNREGGKWKPSIFMPRTASRLFLKVTSIRVERLQDINDSDAIAEGFISIGEFRTAFDKMMTKMDGSDWYTNPWVWVIGFERVPNGS